MLLTTQHNQTFTAQQLLYLRLSATSLTSVDATELHKSGVEAHTALHSACFLL